MAWSLHQLLEESAVDVPAGVLVEFGVVTGPGQTFEEQTGRVRVHAEHPGYEDPARGERVEHGALTLQGGPTVPQFRSLESGVDAQRTVVTLDVDEPCRPPAMRSVALALGGENAPTECTADPRQLLDAAGSDGHRATVPIGERGGRPRRRRPDRDPLRSRVSPHGHVLLDACLTSASERREGVARRGHYSVVMVVRLCASSLIGRKVAVGNVVEIGSAS